MDYKTQKIARIITTAIIMMVFVSISCKSFNMNLPKCMEINNILGNLSQPTFYFIFFVFISYFYQRIVSKLIYNICFSDINNIITDRMFALCKKYNNSFDKNKSYDIFYALIDNDNNLTIKSQDIRLNGYMISLFVDTLIFLLLYLFIYIIFQDSCCCKLVLIFIIISIIGMLVINLLKSFHKKLTLKQLKRIETYLQDDIKKLCYKKSKFEQFIDIFLNDK